ncbi:MAG: lipocalin family protein [Bacteroidia bacterium]|nr:lipocalin family protein [Bacteroidia bacterium]
MKYFMTLIIALWVFTSSAQAIVGTWQLTEEKTCFLNQFVKTNTERELEEGMGSSQNAVARMITFDKKGGAEEGVFSAGKKKRSSMNYFKWNIDGQELHFIDKKSGMITQRFILDELGASTLRIHNAARDCEARVYSKVK